MFQSSCFPKAAEFFPGCIVFHCGQKQSIKKKLAEKLQSFMCLDCFFPKILTTIRKKNPSFLNIFISHT